MHCLVSTPLLCQTLCVLIYYGPTNIIEAIIKRSQYHNHCLSALCSIMSNSCTRSRNIGCAYGSQECQKGLWCCMNLRQSSLLAPRGTAVNTSLSPKMSSSTLQVSQTLELHNSTSESFHFSQVVIFTGDAWAEGIGNNSEASRRFAKHFFFGPFFLLKF